MTIVELRAADRVWRTDRSKDLSAAERTLVVHGVLASAVEAFDPMDKALHVLARERLDRSPYGGRIAGRQFGLHPDLLAVTNLWSEAGAAGEVAAAKGAPEAVADLCRLPPAARAALRRAVDEMARRGMRVLAVARAPVPAGDARAETPRAFAFELLGLVGFADPLRPSAPAAVHECRSAGIRVVMITGDYPQTARAIAKQAGLEAGEVVTGDELDRLADDALRRRVGAAAVFARIAPTQKLRIVEALEANGEVVAMTGDGVNDAPSLKAAHVGIAMGGRGTDVAREASSLVLLDDDLGSIVAAVRLGRRIYDNLRKAMAYILAIHVPIAGLALLPLLLGLPIILTPLHIAFLEMVIDPVCSVVFEAEGEEKGLMRRPPRDPTAPLFTRRLVLWSLLQGGVLLAFVALLFIAALGRGLPEDEARVLAFAALVSTNVGLVLVNRSSAASLVAAFRRPNPALWWVLGSTAAILAAIVLVEPARALFRFGPLHGHDLAMVLLAGLAVLISLELAKGLVRPGGGRSRP
jgi:Ca2+-transporting ATPase